MGVKGLDIFCGVNESDPRRIWYTGITQVMGLNPIQAWIFFFQAFFSLLLK